MENEESYDYTPFLMGSKNAGVLVFPNFSTLAPDSTRLFTGANAASDASAFLFSPEYRAAMGNMPYGVRVDYQNAYGRPFNFNMDEYLASKAEAALDLATPLPADAKIPDEIRSLRNRFRQNTARTLDRFYTSSANPNASNEFYLKKALAAANGDVLPVSVFQEPGVNVDEAYGLKGEKPFGGTAKNHAEGMANMSKADTAGLSGKRLGAAISSDPASELFVPESLRHDPKFVRHAGHAIEISGEPALFLKRPPVNTNALGKFVPRNAAAYANNALGIAGAGLSVYDMYDRASEGASAGAQDRQRSYENRSKYGDVGSYEMRAPYEGELSYFDKNPNVAGMATEDGRVIFNPKWEASATSQQKRGLYLIESARLKMRDDDSWTKIELTPEQKAYFSKLGDDYYSKDENLAKQTLISRIIGGDSIPGADYTPEQMDVAKKIASSINVDEHAFKDTQDFPYTAAFLSETGARLPGYLEGLASMATFGAYDELTDNPRALSKVFEGATRNAMNSGQYHNTAGYSAFDSSGSPVVYRRTY